MLGAKPPSWTGAMGERFGKYGETKPKNRLRQSGLVRKKRGKALPDPRRLDRRKKRQSNKQ